MSMVDEEDEQPGCLADTFFKWDEKYIKPFFIYKYHRIKKQVDFEFDDVLKEYQNIQAVLMEDSSDGDEGNDVLGELTNSELTMRLSKKMSRTSGLKSQYMKSKTSSNYAKLKPGLTQKDASMRLLSPVQTKKLIANDDTSDFSLRVEEKVAKKSESPR